jgi:hypothetical protein
MRSFGRYLFSRVKRDNADDIARAMGTASASSSAASSASSVVTSDEMRLAADIACLGARFSDITYMLNQTEQRLRDSLSDVDRVLKWSRQQRLTRS